MIKIFSPETFNDYENANVYNCIYNQQETQWTIDHHMLNVVVTDSYSDYVNNTYASTDDFLNQMAAQGIITKGDQSSEILQYSPFVEALRSWFDIVYVPGVSALDNNQQTEIFDITRYGDAYIEPSGFITWVNDHDEYFEDSFVPRTWLNEMQKAKVISATDSRGRIKKPKTFKKELKKVLVNKYKKKKKDVTLDKDKLIYDMFCNYDAGITILYDIAKPLLYYIFEAVRQKLKYYKLTISGHFYIFDQGAEVEISDLDNVRGVISEDTIDGYAMFGISAQKSIWYFLDYEKFNVGVLAEASQKGINLPDGIAPLDFVNTQVANGVLQNYTNTDHGVRDGVTTRYRIWGLDTFKVNYSMYRMGVNITDLVSGNGDMILMPSQCDLEAEINGSWTITLQHPYDEEGRNTFIQKGSVLAISGRIAREQSYINQLFRIYDVQNSFNGVEVTAYPVAMESSFECPLDNLYLENVTAQDVASILTGIYPEKYLISTDIQNGSSSIYAQNSNMQEVIAGNDEATFVNTYGGEIIYDNYIYKIRAQAGRRLADSKDYMIQYAADMKGLTINENTFDVVTRVYPTSSEGYNLLSVRSAFNDYVEQFGTLTAEVISGYYFQYNKLIDAVGTYDKKKPAKDGKLIGQGSKFDSDSSAGVNSSNWAGSGGLIPGDFTNKVAIHAACSRFIGAIYDAGLITQILDSNGNDITNEAIISSNVLGPDQPSPILSPEDVWNAVGEPRTSVDASKLPGSTIYMNFPSYDVLGNKLLNSTLPKPFTDALASLRTDLLASKFMSTSKTLVPMNNPASVPKYVDAPNIASYPFVHARSIMHSEISLIEQYDKDQDTQKNDTMTAVENAMAAIKAKTTSLSKQYIKLAHEGKWSHKKRIKTKSENIHYKGEDAKTHIHTSAYNPRTDRIKLPYGYILYSFKDAIGYLKQQAVLSWCKDENEAEIFCRAIENGFQWCEKTNIAKWQWHENSAGKYYGTKNRSDYVKYGYYQIEGKWYFFSNKGYIKKRPIELEEYKWEEDEYEVNKTDADGNIEYEDDGVTPKKEKKKRYRYTNPNNGNYLTSCWIEENKSKHYWVDKDGWRKTFTKVTGKDKDGKDVTKDLDYDDEEWSLTPGEEGQTFKITGYSYGNHKDGHYPKNQWMYINEFKGWFWFDDTSTGLIQGNYQSDATWMWKKYKKGWRFTDQKNTYLWGQWAKIDGKWYWFTAKGGYADTTTDGFGENSQSFKTDDKKPAIDYNREGVSSVGDHETKASEDAEFNADRDGVKAWIQDDFVKELKKEILKQHNNIWDVLRNRLIVAADGDLNELRNESISVEVDFELLRNYAGYEKLKFLEDLYLGDYVHVRSSLHNFDGDIRVVGITYDCITNRPKTMSLGYPVNSFIKRAAKMNSSGTIKHYTGPELKVNDYVTKEPDPNPQPLYNEAQEKPYSNKNTMNIRPKYIETGYGEDEFIDTGYDEDPDIPV